MVLFTKPSIESFDRNEKNYTFLANFEHKKIMSPIITNTLTCSLTAVYSFISNIACMVRLFTALSFPNFFFYV